MKLDRVVGSALLLTLGAGCVAHVPPPPVPEKVVPQVATQADPPADDEGVVTIDATNGPASVSVVLLTVGRSGAFTKSICATTPCTANLPLGSYDVVFASKSDPSVGSTDAVQVARTPSIMRHTMGTVESSPGLQIGGITTATLGGCVLLYGAISLTSSFTSTTTSLATVGVGAAITAIGLYMMYAGRTRIQPGSSVQWTPEGATPPSKPSKQQALYLTPNGMGYRF
jgi:glycerol uptake facilitator-like aquaporin